MFQEKTFLAIIPARKGSKRVPMKNIIPLAGRPLIEWTIEAGKRSTYIDVLCVSTDDIEIAKLSSDLGAQVPFIRPADLSSDSASTFSVVKHCINHYINNEKMEFDYVVLLQPTSPLRNSLDIDTSIELLMDKDADAIISVCEAEHSPLWCNTLPDDMSLYNFISEVILSKRTQELQIYYRLNGAIYISNVIKLLEEERFLLKNNSFAYIMPLERSIDIDNKIDFIFAESLINNN